MFVRVFVHCGFCAILLTFLIGFAAGSDITHGPGDNRTGYELTEYESRSIYERTLVSGNSPFDRWYFGKDQTALIETAQQGFRLFRKAGCAGCHTIQESYALFTDDSFHNTGIGWQASQGDVPSEIQVQLAPGIMVPVPRSVINSESVL